MSADKNVISELGIWMVSSLNVENEDSTTQEFGSEMEDDGEKRERERREGQLIPAPHVVRHCFLKAARRSALRSVERLSQWRRLGT